MIKIFFELSFDFIIATLYMAYPQYAKHVTVKNTDSENGEANTRAKF